MPVVLYYYNNNNMYIYNYIYEFDVYVPGVGKKVAHMKISVQNCEDLGLIDVKIIPKMNNIINARKHNEFHTDIEFMLQPFIYIPVHTQTETIYIL